MSKPKPFVYLNDTSHDFHKTNLITKSGGYDTYACKCGAKGKRHGLSDAIELTNGKESCPDGEVKKPTIVKKVRIKNFTGSNPKIFANLTNGSEHEVVSCPDEYKSKFSNDVWVMGIGEPVRLLRSEYDEI